MSWSQEENAPVILGVSEGAARYMSGFYTVVKMVEGLIHDLNITIPVAIHLDHGSSFEKCKEAIDAGAAGVICGSAVVKIIEVNKDNETELLTKLGEFIRNMKVAT